MKRIAFILATFLAVLCFLSFDIQPVITATQDADADTCLECHADVDMVGEEALVETGRFEGSPHTEDMGITCTDCHVAAAEVEDVYDHGPLGEADCSSCHDDVIESINDSAHNLRRFKENRPTCQSCHGHAHDIKFSDEFPDTPVSKQNQPGTCGQCHREELLDNYMKSTHGQLLVDGGNGGPTCMTCHSSYVEIGPFDDVESIDVDEINDPDNIDPHRIRVADLQRNKEFSMDTLFKCALCHSDDWNAYKESIHGESFLVQGVNESPTCGSCHSSHEILPPSNPESSVYPTKIHKDCEACHDDPKLIGKFGIKANVVKTFDESYHGRAGGLGDLSSANCASCHNNHAIFPSDDARSSVHPDNLQATCGSCHPGATENFVQGSIHSDVGGADNYWANLIRNFYIYLIIGVIGGMVVHNIMDFIRKIRIKWSKSKLEPSVERMTKLERILHAMMATSFILLAYTGFALMFPTEWWVAPINWLGELFGNAEVFRSQLHRFCGLILTFVALHHLWFLFFHKRGIEQRKHFMIRFKDVRDFRENIMWYLGKRKDRPRFGRFTYMEKAEYWALVWGTAVMVLTGFVLWFQEIALMFMPKWLWDVALVVHEYEAILAVLAIVVWHFYYVIINPDEAPLSQAFITGRMPLEEVAHCHAEEFEEIMKEQQAAAEADKESKNVTDA